MENQNDIPVQSAPVNPVVQPIPQRKSSKLLWIILGVIVLIIGLGIGFFLGQSARKGNSSISQFIHQNTVQQ